MGVALNHPVMTMTPRKPDGGIPHFFESHEHVTGFFSDFSDSVDPAKKSS